MHCERCGHENGNRDLIVILAREVVEPILRKLAVIERIVRTEGVIMSDLDNRLGNLTSQLSDLATDLDRELADLKNAVAGNLTADQTAKFDALSDKVAAMKAAIDEADPASNPSTPPAPPATDNPPQV